MKQSSAVKLAAMMFALLAVFVMLQAYWVAQLSLPYTLLALLALSDGMMLGYAASILWIVWLKAGKSFK